MCLDLKIILKKYSTFLKVNSILKHLEHIFFVFAVAVPSVWLRRLPKEGSSSSKTLDTIRHGDNSVMLQLEGQCHKCD